MLSEDQTRDALPGRHGKTAILPGGWQACLIAALSALFVGYWARPGDSATRKEGRTDRSRVAGVTPQDLPDALGTVSGTPEQLAIFRARDDCGRRLAWVTVMRTPGQAPGRIRLQSGNYISPAFDLMETPVRVAIPYPAPFVTGHGVISVIGATTDAVVALTPPWHVPAQAGVERREVTWTTESVCPGASK